MNSRNDDELLSAYHDGELAGEERASVEQMLRDELPAREALDDIAELSRLIHELPRPAAPAELHGAVMQQIRAASPVRALTPPVAGRRRRYWIWSAATAATLLLAVILIPRAIQQSTTGGLALSEHDRALPATAAPEMTPPAAFEAEVAERSMALEAAPGDAGVPPPMAQLPAPPARDSTADFDLSDELKKLESAITGGLRPEIGDVLKSIVHEGDQVLIVQYTVLDVKEAFGQAQLLLEQNGIETITGNPQAAQAAAATSDKFYAILVDAPDDRVGPALAAMGDKKFAHQVATMNLDEINEFPIPAAKPAERGADDAGEQQSARARDFATREQPAPKAAPSATANAVVSKTEEAVAVPIPVPFSEQTMQDLLSADRTESIRTPPAPPTRVQSKSAPTESAGAGAPTDGAAVPPRRRVLIVLIPEQTQP